MRRMTRFVLTWCLLAVFVLTPLGLVLPLRASAQQVSPNLTGIVGPAGIIWYSAASQIVSNTATAGVYLFSGTIPASMFSTGASTNFPASLLGPGNASIPLHLILDGMLDTISSPGTLNLGVNFGVGTSNKAVAGDAAVATVSLLNAFTPGVNAMGPIRIDVWLNPIATATATPATPNITNTVFMHARVEFQNVAALAQQGITTAQPATAIIYNAATKANVNIASAHILNVLWGFGSAGNTLRIFKVLLKQGD